MTYTDPSRTRLALWEQLGKSCLWWWPRKGVCIISDRPDVLRVNDVGQMHCESGPAMHFRDGYSVWSIGGVRVDEQIIMTPDAQTIEQIKGESNAEIKRIRIERYAGRDSGEYAGWTRYMKDVGAKVLNKQRNDIDGTMEILVQCDNERLMLAHCCSTGRRYALRVPNEINNCNEAQNWLSGGLSRYVIDAA